MTRGLIHCLTPPPTDAALDCQKREQSRGGKYTTAEVLLKPSEKVVTSGKKLMTNKFIHPPSTL